MLSPNLARSVDTKKIAVLNTGNCFDKFQSERGGEASCGYRVARCQDAPVLALDSSVEIAQRQRFAELPEFPGV